MLKFVMWFPRNWVSVIKHVGVWNGCGLIVATPIEINFGCQKLIYELIQLKFVMDYK